MNAFLTILTGLIVLSGSVLIGLAPLWKSVEARLRIIGVCCTVAGGLLGVGIGLRSTNKTEALVQSTSKAARNAQEALSYASGGDSRPEIFPVGITGDDGKRGIGFYLEKRGKYPLYGLSVSIGKPHRDAANPAVLLWEQCRSLEFPEMQAESSRLICFEPYPKEGSTFFEGDMTARNGHWEEVIRVRRTAPGEFGIRWALYESKDLTISPNQLVFDLADEKFPAAERRTKIYPLTEVLP